MYDAIVLAGGSAQRLGGADKPGLVIDGTSLLDRVLAACDGAERIVVAGPRRPSARAVTWCREDPPGGGPVAALAAAVALVDAPTVLVLAADLPAVAPAVALLLTAVPPGGWAALADSRVNYLAAAWERTALVAALDRLGDPAGRAVRDLGRPSVLVPDTGGWGLDCDTWADVDRARRA